jgi:hypothetical protein
MSIFALKEKLLYTQFGILPFLKAFQILSPKGIKLILFVLRIKTVKVGKEGNLCASHLKNNQ